MALDGVTSFSRLKDVTNTCKRMRRGLSIGGSSSVQGRKVGRSGDFKGSLTLAMGKCLWFLVKIKVCQSSPSSP